MIYLGPSSYAAMSPKFPTRKFLRCYPPRIKYPAMSVIYGSFGYSTKTIEAFIAKFSDRIKLLEVHISNECSRRSGRDGKQIASQYTVSAYRNALKERGTKDARYVRRQVKQRVIEVLDLLCPVIDTDTILWLSSGLETNVSGIALNHLHRCIGTVFNGKIVFCPMSSTDGYYRADYKECHSATGGRGELWNTDGTHLNVGDGFKANPDVRPDTVYKNFSKVLGTTLAFFPWNAAAQGFTSWGGSSGSLPYEDRTFVYTDLAITETRKLLHKLDKLANS